MSESFSKKVEGLWSATLSKERFLHKYFPVNFAKRLRAHFLQNNIYRQMFLQVF